MQNSGLAPQLIAACEAGAFVLAPNNRVAHSLRLGYAHDAQARGLRAWRTPKILTFNTFALDLWRRHGASRERILSVEQSRLLWTRIVANSAWAESLLSPAAAAGASFRSWERMHSWEISRAELSAEAGVADNA